MKPLVLLGGVEAGGTKFHCVIGNGVDEILAREVFPTTTPAETLHKVRNFFDKGVERFGPLDALGVATFGPADLNKKSETFGYITSTPKQSWSYTDMAGFLSQSLEIPVVFETDVNGAAIGEALHGAAQGLENFVYVTVGTGIGAGIVVNGALIHGVTHPEIGHMIMPQEPAEIGFQGNCPFHKGCLEGLASGPAMKKRWGVTGDQLPATHPAWQLEARYLALMCVNLTVCYSPERIILSGGVMAQEHLFEKIREKFSELINDYVKLPHVRNLDTYIVPSALNGAAGELGALALAYSELKGVEPFRFPVI